MADSPARIKLVAAEAMAGVVICVEAGWVAGVGEVVIDEV